MDKEKVLEYIFGQMGVSMRETSPKIKLMDKEN
jgi:hypothetical protein